MRFRLRFSFFWLLRSGRWFSNRFHWSFLRSAFAATYLTVLVLLIIVVLVPVGLSVREAGVGAVPIELQSSLAEQLFAYGAWLARMILLAAFFSLLILPLEFLGVFF